jgi:thiosulfate/3-mercaptopyruvate sulfurtransferase
MSDTSLPLLVDAATVRSHLDDDDLVIVDATVRLELSADGTGYERVSGRASYEGEHIPGAVFADLIADFSDPDAESWFTLPSPERLATAAGALGVGDGARVVVYTQTMPQFATRLWWLLRYAGFDAVSLLDGGLEAWREAGLPISDAHVTPAPRTFTPSPRSELLAVRADVEAAVEAGTGSTCLVNALSEEDFRGEGPSAYGRPGRIPGSVSLPWSALLQDGSDRLRPRAELRERFAAAGVRDEVPVVSYCGGGIAASLDVFALALIGRTDGVRLYDGSLTEWAGDPALPLQTG